MRTLYQLSSKEFLDYISKLKGGEKLSARGQLIFESNIIERGYKLDIDKYKYNGNKGKASIICPKGHHVDVIPNGFNRGQGCIKCSGFCKEKAKEDFEKAVLDRGYSFCEKTYVHVNNSTKVNLICSNGHKYEAIPYSFKNGSGCRKCAVESQMKR